MARVIGLFPTPLVKVDGFLDTPAVSALAERTRALHRQQNSATDLLSHTQMIEPGSDPLYEELARRAEPHVVSFGALLFAGDLQWTVKEMWLNVLERGGNQFLHTHANSFISGVVYLTTPDPGATTLFRKPAGGAEFIFRNDVPMGHYSSDSWMVPEVTAGDLVLFPSYLLHGVPPNEGPQRITIAFNAIPDRLDSLGYQIGFTVGS